MIQAFTAVSTGSLSGSMFGSQWKTRSPFINGTDNITHTHANTHIHGQGWAISTFYWRVGLAGERLRVSPKPHSGILCCRKGCISSRLLSRSFLLRQRLLWCALWHNNFPADNLRWCFQCAEHSIKAKGDLDLKDQDTIDGCWFLERNAEHLNNTC